MDNVKLIIATLLAALVILGLGCNLAGQLPGAGGGSQSEPGNPGLPPDTSVDNSGTTEPVPNEPGAPDTGEDKPVPQEPGSDNSTLPAGSADIRGAITNVQQGTGGDNAGSVLIEGIVEADTAFDKASVRVTSQTQIFQQVGQERRPVTFETLKVGQRAQALFTGPVAESYPVQATASEIIILE